MDKEIKKWFAPLEEEGFEDSKGIIRICKSKKDLDNTMAKGKRTKRQTTVYKTLHRKDRSIRTPLKPGNELRCSRRISSSCLASGTRRVTLVIR